MARWTQTLEERFWSKVQKAEGCWLWMGSLSATGYGQFRVGTTMVRASRFAYEFVNGPIGDSKVFACHHCDNRRCVNPSHIFLGTNLDNVQDMVAKGRKAPSQNKNKTHCKYGHEFTPDNTLITKIGGRTCWICKRRWDSIYNQKRKGKALA